jgi:hypothetical protein
MILQLGWTTVQKSVLWALLAQRGGKYVESTA